MNMNVNIPPYPTPPHHQTKTGKRKKTKTPKRQQNTQAPAAPMAASHVATLPSTETVGNRSSP